MTTWHTGEHLLTAYVDGALDALEGASVEQHLLVCAACRTRIGAVVDPAALTAGWDRVRSGMERPPQPSAIRLARRLGLSDSLSVLLAASASLRTAWLSASFVALGFAFLATRLSDGSTLWPFLLVAPLIPVIGVAASYNAATDSLETLIVTSPYGRTRLILVRALGVLVTCLPVAVLLGLALPGPKWVAAAWLGPALTLVPVLLALASFIGPRAAAGAVAISWSATVALSVRFHPPTWPVETGRQLGLLALALVACGVLVARSRATRKIGAAL
ncbi:anti-sigma factor family protein [Marmoricola sp. RAF53]|uniref:anti-sigma factor family protein n=1 Tax=Marmoricola sp. RAF53 TaxID=3233059 RepID=UPI003F99CD47